MKQEYMSKQDGKLAEIYESIKNRMESQQEYIIYIIYESIKNRIEKMKRTGSMKELGQCCR